MDLWTLFHCSLLLCVAVPRAVVVDCGVWFVNLGVWLCWVWSCVRWPGHLAALYPLFLLSWWKSKCRRVCVCVHVYLQQSARCCSEACSAPHRSSHASTAGVGTAVRHSTKEMWYAIGESWNTPQSNLLHSDSEVTVLPISEARCRINQTWKYFSRT